ncbi:MAG TPA: branched-chain amino acid ABC transporter permease [Spirochaetia bacterium]|nr:branched-chain amino acid ABC transporter permease [Spirochaetia bacterium]
MSGSRFYRPSPGSLTAVVVCAVLLILPAFLSGYYTYLLASIFEAALLAVSLNFILGYGGLLQLSQATFYGVGAYAAALVLTKTALPFWVVLVAGPVTAGVFALFIGWFCVRLRQLYFGMLTLALGQLVWALVDRWYNFTGGDNGINTIPLPAFLTSPRGGYYLALVIMAGSLAVMYRLIRSPFGLTLQAIRDNPVRSAGVGVDVQRHQLTAFIVASLFAGLAGVLHVVVAGSVDPSLLDWTKSAEVLIMLLLGGLATFIGPAVGAAILVVLSMVLGIYTDYWLFVLGLILVVLALFLPQGIIGYLEGRLKKKA